MTPFRLSLFGALFALPALAQSFSVSDSIVDYPPGALYEKAIGYFTSTSYPSYFLGTSSGAWIYDTQRGITITVASTGFHYEHAAPFYANGATYPDIIASVDDTLVRYVNPANGGANSWGRVVMNPSSGCHDLVVADLDGDSRLDVSQARKDVRFS